MVVDTFPSPEHFQRLIELARDEDLGPQHDDVTSRLCLDHHAEGVGVLLLKKPGVVCGLPVVEHVCRAYDRSLVIESNRVREMEGRAFDATPVELLRIRGPLASLLSAERVILNFVQRMSGVATLTHRFVQAVAGTHARICDTRKTIPGFRALDKYAVRAGGGVNHRAGLHDMLLLKDNHLAGVPTGRLAAHLRRVVAHSLAEDATRPIEVEVTTLEQLREVLRVDGVGFVLLDNMDCATMARAVELRDSSGRKGHVELEASGGVSLETVRTIAETGVDRISVGALTHSASALDISLEVVSG
jgi:nicotinate-nucleotide pyrophosphorylase (carboxylating)